MPVPLVVVGARVAARSVWPKCGLGRAVRAAGARKHFALTAPSPTSDRLAASHPQPGCPTWLGSTGPWPHNSQESRRSASSGHLHRRPRTHTHTVAHSGTLAKAYTHTHTHTSKHFETDTDLHTHTHAHTHRHTSLLLLPLPLTVFNTN